MRTSVFNFPSHFPFTYLTFTSIPLPLSLSLPFYSHRLLACLGEESGHNLIADLSRTQQLVEILETGFIFNSKRYVRTCTSENSSYIFFCI